MSFLAGAWLTFSDRAAADGKTVGMPSEISDWNASSSSGFMEVVMVFEFFRCDDHIHKDNVYNRSDNNDHA
jgi:hypothetical protein